MLRVQFQEYMFLVVEHVLFSSGYGRKTEGFSLFVLDYKDTIYRNAAVWPLCHQ